MLRVTVWNHVSVSIAIGMATYLVVLVHIYKAGEGETISHRIPQGVDRKEGSSHREKITKLEDKRFQFSKKSRPWMPMADSLSPDLELAKTSPESE